MFLFHLITGRHYILYKYIVAHWFTATAMLLRSLKRVFWQKSTFCICYSTLTLKCCQYHYKVSTSSMFLIKFICWQHFFTLSVCECSTFFFINWIFKTHKPKNSLEACFLLRAVLKLLRRYGKPLGTLLLFLLNIRLTCLTS